MVNRICIEGRLARDSEVKMAGDTPLTKFRMVHNKWSKAKGEQPNFFSVQVWKEMHIPKGTAVLIDGELEEYSYDKDGERKSFTYIKAFKVTPIQFIKLDQSAPTHAGIPVVGNAPLAQKVFASPDPDDDIPF